MKALPPSDDLADEALPAAAEFPGAPLAAIPVARRGPPSPVRVVVIRGSLIELLSRGVSRSPVTLVTGPPGSGKTSLAESWMRSLGAQQWIAWLALNADDNDPATFWCSVLAAFDRAGVELPGLERPVPGEPLLRSFTIRLAAHLDDLPRSVVLVLDDFDNLERQEVVEALDLLARNVGERLRLVLCSRDRLPAPLGREEPTDALTRVRVGRTPPPSPGGPVF